MLKSPRDRLLDDIVSRLHDCSHDELLVLGEMLGRLELGRRRYGFLDLTKARDWDREAAEELLDMSIYRACATLAERMGTDHKVAEEIARRG